MSKTNKAIAALSIVASFGVAAAPMATFAADATYNSDIHTDRLNVTVLPTCAFGAANANPAIAGVTHNAASNTPLVNTTNAATWTTTGESPVVADDMLGMTPDAAEQTEHPSLHTATYSIYAGTADDNMGSTTLTVVCNQNNGYKIFTQAANLSEGTETINIVAAGNASASATGYTITVANDDSRESVTLAQVTDATKLATVTRNAASAATGDHYTYTYGIGVAPSQKAATYTGDVVYTLVQQLGS
ncbi:hypothetical protein IKG02_03260 [Candidatus Saccharibacteria bacterium]|nr:hypothetical protein [Candidatus Saccharibacteria bacterium]